MNICADGSFLRLCNNMNYLFNCPYCKEIIWVDQNDVNCMIFRCGVFKDTYLPIDPHLPKDKCDNLVQNGKIIGCGKPFKFDGNSLEMCEYI